jgi:hypothetical protein
MKEYKVTWIIEVCAEDATQAAAKARLIQLDPTSTATFFLINDELQICLKSALPLCLEINAEVIMHRDDLVLVHLSENHATPYVVWDYNQLDQSVHTGSYVKTFKEAVEVFSRRLQ